jgi:RNA polymerase sigma factor (sigma-70 family)
VTETDIRLPIVAALTEDLDTGFVALFDGYRNVVFSAALRLCGRWADAEDLTAEAFLRAYRALAGYEPQRIATLQPRPWLMTILANLWRNTARSAARHPPPAPLEAAPEVVDPAEPTERVAERSETGRELAALLGLLTEEQRLAVVLRHVADLPIAEIATVLGTPEGTVKSHISRGLKRLRTLYPEEAR